MGSLETALKHLDEVNGIDEITVVAGQNTSLYESLVTLSESMRTKTIVYGYTTNYFGAYEILFLASNKAWCINLYGGCYNWFTYGVL